MSTQSKALVQFDVKKKKRKKENEKTKGAFSLGAKLPACDKAAHDKHLTERTLSIFPEQLI